MPKTAQPFSAITEIENLSKEEIVQLLRDRGWWAIAHLSRRDFLWARAEVAGKKTDAAFARWQACTIPVGVKQSVIWQAREEKERLYEVYQRLYRKYVKLSDEALNAN